MQGVSMEAPAGECSGVPKRACCMWAGLPGQTALIPHQAAFEPTALCLRRAMPADGACEGGDEPCSHGVLGTWVFVSNRSISETSALPQSVALRTMAGLQFGTGESAGAGRQAAGGQGARC